MSQWFIDPNVVGLAYDAAGIFVFGVPAVILSTEQIASAGESFWDYDAGAMRKLVEQRLDTFVGSLLLVAGFLGQFTSAVGLVLFVPAAVAVWVALPFVLICYLMLRSRLVQRQLDRAISIAKQRAAQQ